MIIVSLSAILVSDPAPYVCVCVCVLRVGYFWALFPEFNISWVSSASAYKCCDCLKVGHGHFFCIFSAYNSHIIPQFDDIISVKAFLNKRRHDQVYASAFSHGCFFLLFSSTVILVICNACDFWDLFSCVVKEYLFLRYDVMSLVKRFLYRLTRDKASHPRRMGSSDISLVLVNSVLVLV
jgi:hypothetical protein